MRSLRALPVGLGLATLGLAVVAVFVGLPDAIAVVASDALVFGLAGVVAIVGLLTLTRSVVAPSSPSREIDVPALERPTGREPVPTPGSSPLSKPSTERERVTETIDTALEHPEIDAAKQELHRLGRLRRDARTAVRETAIAVLAARHDVSSTEAVDRVRDGTWTDDPRAAEFLATDLAAADGPSRRTRFVDWLVGERYQRGLEAAVDEIERLEAGRGTDRGRDQPWTRDGGLNRKRDHEQSPARERDETLQREPDRNVDRDRDRERRRDRGQRRTVRTGDRP